MAAPPSSLAELATALQGSLLPEKERKPYEEALQNWEACDGFASALLHLYSAPPPQVGHPERLLAILCLKNAVTRRWHSHRDDEPPISDEEKERLRNGLLHAVQEPDRQLALQLQLVVAIIARMDGLIAWPSLLPRLLDESARPSHAEKHRAVAFLFRVVKQQATRRLMPHRKQFFALAAELLPRLQPLRHATYQDLLVTLTQQDAAAASATLCARGEQLGACVTLCKLERQLLIHGWAALHLHAEPCALIGTTLQLLHTVQAQQDRLAQVAPAAAERLTPLLLAPAKILVEVQDLHPLAMAGYLPQAISFSMQQLHNRSFTSCDDDEKVLVRALMFLRNALSTSAYLPSRNATPQALECHQALQAFFASPLLEQLCRVLVCRALLLTSEELLEYEEDPEAFVHEETIAREAGSLRKCAERCLLTLADTSDCRQKVQQSVLQIANEAAAAGTADLAAVLALDACYLAMGLAGAVDSLTEVLARLQQHCAAASAEHAHLLRRRAAWLLGWMLKLPQADMQSALMYSMLSSLLTDEHAGVRMTATVALHHLFDVTDVSPRDSLTKQSSIDSVDSDRLLEPLAELAATALLPVLRLSLCVKELDSRWRMEQLLCRLLERLTTTPFLLEPHIGSLAQWLQSAWDCAAGEQLLQEATIDTAATMLRCCGKPPLSLLQPSLLLVARSLQSTSGGAPPIGTIELSLKLWRTIVSSLHPPLSSEISPQLKQLEAHLPSLVSLGDELLRPVMHLYDWYILQDRLIRACGGDFVASRAEALASLFEGAIVRNPERKGALAAVSTMHTVILCAPDAAMLLQPALQAAVRFLLKPNTEGDGQELLAASLAGLLGRTVLSATHLFSAAVAAEAPQSPQPARILHSLVSRWLEVSDSIVLSLQRKITALAFGTLLTLDASLLPLLGEMLSFCVSVISDLEPAQHDALPPKPVGRPCTGDHGGFAERLEQHSIDPLVSVPLRQTLQECMARSSAAYGDALQRHLQAVDNSLLLQIRKTFDGIS
ncbi:hypothetical protein AB1Y20_019523 [Prymnesium parvum]|uniref:Importin N-terminal domain-containing protein n=1 Tax=Prymnesium parvum TaxID=97485 RepID=A0AB34JUL5_PRYPA